MVTTIVTKWWSMMMTHASKPSWRMLMTGTISHLRAMRSSSSALIKSSKRLSTRSWGSLTWENSSLISSAKKWRPCLSIRLSSRTNRGSRKWIPGVLTTELILARSQRLRSRSALGLRRRPAFIRTLFLIRSR